jgi:hypothetical protein
MEQYLENVREIERRIQRVESRNATGDERALPGAPAGVPDSFDEHMKLMFDLQALAFQADVTRVFSLKTGRDASSRVYPESGVSKGFHPASHHGNREDRIMSSTRSASSASACRPASWKLRRRWTARPACSARRSCWGLADGRRQRAQPPPLPARPVARTAC